MQNSELSKDQVTKIIQMFGERRKNRFGCEDYYTLCGYRKSDGSLIHYDGTLLSSSCSLIPANRMMATPKPMARLIE